MEAHGAYEHEEHEQLFFVNMCVSGRVFLGKMPQWSLRAWFILVPVAQRFEPVALPIANKLQPFAGLSASQTSPHRKL